MFFHSPFLLVGSLIDPITVKPFVKSDNISVNLTGSNSIDRSASNSHLVVSNTSHIKLPNTLIATVHEIKAVTFQLKISIENILFTI